MDVAAMCQHFQTSAVWHKCTKLCLSLLLPPSRFSFCPSSVVGPIWPKPLLVSSAQFLGDLPDLMWTSIIMLYYYKSMGSIIQAQFNSCNTQSSMLNEFQTCNCAGERSHWPLVKLGTYPHVVRIKEWWHICQCYFMCSWRWKLLVVWPSAASHMSKKACRKM